MALTKVKIKLKSKGNPAPSAYSAASSPDMGKCIEAARLTALLAEKVDNSTFFEFRDLFDSLFEKVTKNGVTSIRAKHGLWTDEFLSARGKNEAGGGTGGLDIAMLEDYLTGNKYTTQPWVTSALGNYYSKAEADARFLRQHQSLANYVTLGTAQVISGVKTFTQEVIATDKWITAKIITGETGAANNTVQSKKAHGIELGYPKRDYMNFNELGGVFNFYKTNLAYTAASGNGTLVASITERGITAASFIRQGGTSSQFLMADGSVKALTDITSAYVTALGTSGNYLTWTKNGATNNVTVPYATNADLLDGWHAAGQTGRVLKKSGFVSSATSGLSSYWCKLATINVTTNENKDITLYLHSAYDALYGTLNINIRINSGSESYTLRMLDGNIPVDRIRLYKAASAPRVFELWVNAWRQYGVINAVVLSETDRTATESGAWVTMHTTYFTTVQTPTLATYITPTYTSLMNNASSATQLQTVRKIWGRDFNGTQDVSGDMTGVRNINTAATPIGTVYASNWFRSTGATGWYSETYGGGWYMSDTTWIRNFGNKGLYMGTAIIRTDNYFDREGYSGASWFNGYGAYNTAIVNNSGQTPLMVAYRSGQTPAVTGANRLFSLELLNTGTELRFSFGGFGNGGGCPVLMTSYGELRVGRSIQSTAWFSDSGQIRAHAVGTNYYLGMGAATDGYGVIQSSKVGTGAIPLLLNPKGGNVGINTSAPGYTLDVNGSLHVRTLVYFDSKARINGDLWTNGQFFLNASGYDQQPYMSGAFGKFNLAFHRNGVWVDTVMTIMPDGAANMTGPLHVDKGIYTEGYVTARGQNTSSDARLKDVTGNVELDIRAIARAPAVFFRWKDTGGEDVGSIAQYWQALMPQLTPRTSSGMLDLQYDKAALLGVVTVSRRVLDHEERIAALEAENASLKATIENMRGNA